MTIQRLSQIAQQLEGDIAPLDKWSPEFCGQLPLEITRDGRWLYQKSEITRPALIKLFARVLCQEQGHYYLKTPVEKVAITVEDAPLLIVGWQAQQQEGGAEIITFTDNVGRQFTLGSVYPLVLKAQESGQCHPYLLLPHGVEAKIARSVYYQLAQRAVECDVNGQKQYCIYSANNPYPLG